MLYCLCLVCVRETQGSELCDGPHTRVVGGPLSPGPKLDHQLGGARGPLSLSLSLTADAGVKDFREQRETTTTTKLLERENLRRETESLPQLSFSFLSSRFLLSWVFLFFFFLLEEAAAK